MQIEKISNAVEDILRYHRDVIVSLREIYNTLTDEYNYKELTFQKLTDTIIEDPRFEYIEMPDYFEHFTQNEKTVFDRQKDFIEDMGFYSGPRVKLSGAEIEYEKIVEILGRKVDNMMEILLKLWEERPLHDHAAEDQLLAILAKGQRMQREIKTLSQNDNSSDIIQFLKKASDL